MQTAAAVGLGEIAVCCFTLFGRAFQQKKNIGRARAFDEGGGSRGAEMGAGLCDSGCVSS